jgi:hypothetical protein
MSRSILLYWPYTIEEATFLSCIRELGGTVQDEESLDVAFRCGDCHVWIYGARRNLAGRFESTSESTVERLGAPARLGVTLNLSHEPEAATLALEVARQFLHRWPGLVQCAMYQALTFQDVKRTLSAILSKCTCIALGAEPSISDIIDNLGGLVIGRDDHQLIESISAELRALKDGLFDPSQDEVVGLLPLGTGHIWLLRRPFPAESASLDQVGHKVREQAVQRLGQVPVCLLRMVSEYRDTHEVEDTVTLFFERLLERTTGVMLGLFFLDLELVDIDRMLAGDEGMLVA